MLEVFRDIGRVLGIYLGCLRFRGCREFAPRVQSLRFRREALGFSCLGSGLSEDLLRVWHSGLLVSKICFKVLIFLAFRALGPKLCARRPHFKPRDKIRGLGLGRAKNTVHSTQHQRAASNMGSFQRGAPLFFPK